MQRPTESSRVSDFLPSAPSALPGQVVLVLQGGGALGSYQAGVHQALHEAGIEPDWIVGTSIGAINASLIAGNAPQDRLPRLNEFWSRVQRARHWDFRGVLPAFGDKWSYWTTLTHGIPGFFTPNPLAHAGDCYPLGADQAGYYSTAPLESTLAELVDFDLINRGGPRLTVGAAHVRTSHMTYFDSRRCKLDVKHIMASGALPPAFPAVRVDGELYWDGGILSNTPTEVCWTTTRAGTRSSSPSISGIQLAPSQARWRKSSTATRTSNIPVGSQARSRDTSKRTGCAMSSTRSRARLPGAERDKPEVRELMGYGCQTRMHVVQLLAPQLDHEDHTKDVDFSPAGIRQRWDAGYAHTKAVLAREPWVGQFDPLSGVILHESEEYRASDRSTRASAAAPLSGPGRGQLIQPSGTMEKHWRSRGLARELSSTSFAKARMAYFNCASTAYLASRT